MRAILLRGLSVIPGQRFPNMEALLKEIDQLTAKRAWLPLMVGVGGAAKVMKVPSAPLDIPPRFVAVMRK